MTAEDVEVARNTRRELGKRPIDSTMIDVQVKNGRITLGGRVAHKRDQRGADLRWEIDHVSKLLMNDRLVKQVIDQLHYKVEFDEDGDKEKDPRGRMRQH